MLRAFFYGNWFYGICAVALSVEAALQQRVPLNGWAYHVLLFLCTVVFYMHAYRGHMPVPNDERSQWCARHFARIRMVQRALIGAIVALLAWVLVEERGLLEAVTPLHAFLIAVFPAVGAAYYGTGVRGLRRIGWLKPFVIGFVWAGAVTVYPVLFHSLVVHGPYPFAWIGALLFLKNMMFIAVLGILFDIKDHAEDHRQALRTLVVQRGLRATLFRVALPLSILGLITFVVYGTSHGFSWPKMLLNAVPFALLLAVIWALRKRRSLLYYLVVVDGLMLVKALFGSVAMHWF